MISLEQTSRHTDDSTMVLEHLLQHSSLRTNAALRHEHLDHAHATAELSVEEDSTDASSTASTEDSEHSEPPEKLMSTTRMAGMQTAIALQARQGAEEPLKETLTYDFLVGADGGGSKVCFTVSAVTCLRFYKQQAHSKQPATTGLYSSV